MLVIWDRDILRYSSDVNNMPGGYVTHQKTICIANEHFHRKLTGAKYREPEKITLSDNNNKDGADVANLSIITRFLESF